MRYACRVPVSSCCPPSSSLLTLAGLEPGPSGQGAGHGLLGQVRGVLDALGQPQREPVEGIKLGEEAVPQGSPARSSPSSSPASCSSLLLYLSVRGYVAICFLFTMARASCGQRSGT